MPAHEGRTAIVRRLAWLLVTLPQYLRRPTALALAARLGVTERTVRRDLAALRDAGVDWMRMGTR